MNSAFLKALFFWIIIFCGLELFGQDPKMHLLLERKDTNYISDYRRSFSLKLVPFFEQGRMRWVNQEGNDITYQTNASYPRYALSGTFRYINFEFSTSPTSLSTSIPGKEVTNNTSFALGATFSKIWIRNVYERYTGYFVQNQSQDFQNIVGVSRPDIRSHTYYGSIYYGFNGEKYSHRSTVWQSEGQRLSAGSLILGVNWAFNWMQGDSLLLPESGSPLNSQEVASMGSAGANLGYVYSYAFNHRYYLTLMGAPGIGFIRQKRKIGENKYYQDVYPALIGEARVILGYSSTTWFYGSTVIYYQNGNLLGENPQTSGANLWYWRFFIGYRFPLKLKGKLFRYTDLAD